MLNSIVSVLDSGGAGGGGSFESIATATGTGSSNVITFTSIPSTYKHLQLRFNIKTVQSRELLMRFNSDSGSNYFYHKLYGNGTVAEAGFAAPSTKILVSPDALTNATNPAVGILDVIDYASASKNKTTRHFVGIEQNGVGNSTVDLSSGCWASLSAVNTISITSDNALSYFSTDTTISLYGIKGA